MSNLSLITDIPTAMCSVRNLWISESSQGTVDNFYSTILSHLYYLLMYASNIFSFSTIVKNLVRIFWSLCKRQILLYCLESVSRQFAIFRSSTVQHKGELNKTFQTNTKLRKYEILLDHNNNIYPVDLTFITAIGYYYSSHSKTIRRKKKLHIHTHRLTLCLPIDFKTKLLYEIKWQPFVQKDHYIN